MAPLHLNKQDSQKNGWHIVGAHVTFGSPRIKPVHTWSQGGVDHPTILVIGDSGVAISKQVQKKCDSFLVVPDISRSLSVVKYMDTPDTVGVAIATLMGGRLKQFGIDSHNAALASGEDPDRELDQESDQDNEDEPDQPAKRVSRFRKDIKPERKPQETDDPFKNNRPPAKKSSRLAW